MGRKFIENNGLIATGLALTLLVSGTYAWQAFSQEVTNEIIDSTGEAGGRLHDDFDGSNKDVYVENYTTIEDGANVYARIRLKEYFEYGPNAGELVTPTPSTITLVRGDILNTATPDITDVNTWDIYNYGSVADPAAESIRTYRGLEFGGSTVYMPTFNQDRTSLAADINGTYGGTDGDRTTDFDRYDDYDVYIAGQVSLPQNVITASDPIGTPATHTAKETKTATVMSMAQWKAVGYPQGDIWVFDTDGWAYYAYPIEPETASGLLLDQVVVRQNPTEEWYYAIEVVAQIASAGDWGTAPDSSDPSDVGSGMYADNLSDDGLYLLNKVSGKIKATDLTLTNTDSSQITILDLQLTYEETVSYLASILVENGIGLDSEEKLNWSIELVPGGDGTTLTDDEINDTISVVDKTVTFSPVEGMEGNYYAITVASDLTPSKYVTINVYVYDPAEHFEVTAEDDATSVVMSPTWSKELNELVNGVTWDRESGEPLQLYATHVDGSTPADVIWSIEETTGTSGLITNEINSAIGSDGVFTATSDMVGCTYTITATYNKKAPILTDSIEIEIEVVTSADYDPVTIDGVDFYVLDKDTVTEYSTSGKAGSDKESYLIFSKNQVITGSQYFTSNVSSWANSTMNKTTLPTWLSGYSYLSSIAVRTKIETDGYYTDATALEPNTSGFAKETTYNNVFLLSQPEFLTHIGLGDSRAAASGSWGWWLRSAFNATSVRSILTDGSSFSFITASSAYGVRPALWVSP